MADYDPETQRALFAKEFENVQTTDLDQRRRRQQVLTDAKKASEERDQSLFEERQRQNPKLMQAVTGRMRERRQFEEGLERGDLARQRFEFEQGREQRANTIAQRRLQLDTNREERFLRKEQLEIDRLDREEDDTLAAEEDELKLRESTTPGSSAYQRGVLDIFLRRPYVNKDYRNQALKAAGYTDPEVAFKEAADAVQAGASRATAKLPGGGVATFVSPKEEKPQKQSTGRLDSLRTKIAKVFEQKPENRDQDYLNYLQGEFEKERSKGTAPAQQAAQAPATAPASTAPPSFESVAATVAPGGTFTWGGKTWRKPQAK